MLAVEVGGAGGGAEPPPALTRRRNQRKIAARPDYPRRIVDSDCPEASRSPRRIACPRDSLPPTLNSAPGASFLPKCRRTIEMLFDALLRRIAVRTARSFYCRPEKTRARTAKNISLPSIGDSRLARTERSRHRSNAGLRRWGSAAGCGSLAGGCDLTGSPTGRQARSPSVPPRRLHLRSESPYSFVPAGQPRRNPCATEKS